MQQLNKARRAILILVLTGLSAALSLQPRALASGITFPPGAQPQASGNGLTPRAYLPLALNNYQNLSVNPQDRQASLDFYNTVYLASEGVAIEWTGDHDTCSPGGTSAAFRAAVQLRINYFRAMAGVPANVVLADEKNHKAQQAALMMSVNRQLSHAPNASWACYTDEGAEAAGSSNLFLGVYGPQAISGYIYDPGEGNYPVGHRRWILHPQTRTMGTGDIPPTNGRTPANALWVFDVGMFGPRSPTREAFVAWPPPGYVPHPVVYPRWSFAYPMADFYAATVTMSRGTVPIPLTVLPVVNGYGENTLVWEPEIDLRQAPIADTTYTVEVKDVQINGISQDFTYAVTLVNLDAFARGEGS